MASAKKVLIVGGGIGGLATAIGLRRHGIAVDVAELRTEWTIYHVGVVVQANFVRAMGALGIADEAVAIGYPYNGLTFQDLHGKVLNRLEGSKVAGEKYPTHLGMTRPALHKLLSETASSLGAKLHLGRTYTRLEQTPAAVRVTFNDGSEAAYDAVIGADGVYSHVRRDVFGPQYVPQFTGQGTWRYNVPRPPELTSSFYAMGPGLPFGKCGFIPLNQQTGYVWLVQSEPGNPFHPPEKLAEIFRSRLAGCTGVMASFRDQILDSSLVVYRPLESLLMPEPWYKDRIILIGDAAHATTPHMGQGAAQAVEDAVVISEELARNDSVQAAFDAFMERRYERCKFIVESSLQLGKWEQQGAPNTNAVELTRKMLEVVAAPI